MVQIISLDLDTKNVEPIKTKHISNVDFLELLLKDIENTTNETKDKTKDIKDKNLLSDKKTKKTIDLNIDEIKVLFQNSSAPKEDMIKEIKNILESKMKQENIILTKKESNEFKKIDNLKDLIKFADKKGLNIKKINFEIPKTTIESINTEQKIPTAKILEQKHDKTTSKTQTMFVSKNIKDIKLDNKQANKHTKTIHQNTNKVKNIQTLLQQKQQPTSKQTISQQSQIQSEIKIDKKNIQTNSKVEKNIDIVENKETNKTKKTIQTHNIKTTSAKKIDLTTILNNTKPKDIVEDKEVKEVKEIKEPKELNINNQQMVNEIKAKATQAKQTIEHFKNNLDEAIKNYKPPISKVNIELNPKNLGKVEVTIIQRGNNIQVNMHTDQNNVALFQTHQAEFRQALANIGFSNIDMSFNSNQDRERKQNQAKKTYKENERIEDIGEIEIKADYRYA